MAAPVAIDESRWERLAASGEAFTCYTSAIATWVAQKHEDWGAATNAGLRLTLTDAGGGLFGFACLRPQLRAELGLRRTGAQDGAEAVDGVLEELRRGGRVIVAGDGFHLPWQVAFGRAHGPHWFVLTGTPDAPQVIDPFAARNELGVQTATRVTLSRAELGGLLRALPGTDPVHRLRESLALGDETSEAIECAHQWFVSAEVQDWVPPQGADGPNAVARLALHFREHGQNPNAYSQVDDIWSIGRHRAFLVDRARARSHHDGDDELSAWVSEHGEPLAKRWGHMAPLLMQARLSLAAGRLASDSVARTLEDLAQREMMAGQAFPSGLDAGSI